MLRLELIPPNNFEGDLLTYSSPIEQFVWEKKMSQFYFHIHTHKSIDVTMTQALHHLIPVTSGRPEITLVGL